MFYKVIKDNKVVDVLDKLIYLKWQDKHKMMILSDENNAQAILSSDQSMIWHVKGFYDIPANADNYETVEIIKIDEIEYKQLSILNGKTPEQIIDDFVLSLLENNII